MSTENQIADPATLTGLLWSPSTRVGRTGLTLATVVRAAVSIADTDGLANLTMRRLADEVGVGTMTLYRYVPGRRELIELMLDQMAGEVYAARPLPRTRRTLRTAVEHIAKCNWEHLTTHRWITEIPPGRPIVGPGEVTKYERELEPLDVRGLSDHDMDSLLSGVLGLVAAMARWQIALDDARNATDLSDEQWWAATAPTLGRVLSEDDYPVSSRVGTSVASAGDPYRVLQFSLAAILDAVTARLT